MFTTVYSAGWVAHEVPVQSAGATEFLGGVYDTDNSGHSTLEWLQAKAELVVQCIRSRKGFSAASKVAVITMSTLHSLVYKAINSVLGHEELESVDKIIDNVLVSSTKNMFSYPRKLLHMSRAFGGLGIPSFSYLAESRKLQRLFSCMRSTQLHGLAARGILSRTARKHGFFSSPGQGIVIIPSQHYRRNQKIYCDGPVTMLARHGLYLCRHGYSTTLADPGNALLPLLPRDHEEAKNYCLKYGLYTLGDVTQVKNGCQQWYLPPELSVLRSTLPGAPVFNDTVLLVGQFW